LFSPLAAASGSVTILSKEIWLGPVLGNNREQLLARCKQYVSAARTNRLLYLVASQPLLDVVTEKLLDGQTTNGVWGEFPVYLFRGFVRRVLAAGDASEARPAGQPDLATQARTPIDRAEFPLRRSLISQILKQLAATGRLPAIRPLANRDGCVNTIASLIGELQRAGRTPEEFHEAILERENEDRKSKTKDQSPKSQTDFDRDVALIYQIYSNALDANSLTDEDADQLRALQVLRQAMAEAGSSLSWLDDVELLVLDGFFDFTPVQGEILRHLVPLAPNVIVNLNYDQANEEIFRPFQSTIDRLKSIADFDVQFKSAENPRHPISARLFNSTPGEATAPPPAHDLRCTLLECGDREVEIRSIAKEIKRLVTNDGYELREIALVVRERATYAEAILRIMADESIPCQLQRRVEAQHVPSLRA
jgi:ATP-dependent helicase/DNAse subunit B